MPEADDYFKLAASNFKKAEAHLEDAERSLRLLREKLDNCLELVSNIQIAEPSRWDKPSVFARGRQMTGVSRLPLYSS